MRSPRRLAVGLALTSALAAPTAAPARTADQALPAHATAAKRADLVVAGLGNPPASLHANEAFTVGLKVVNKGKAKARSSAVRFYLGTGAKGDVRVDGVAVTKALRARKRGKATARLTAPGYLAPGSYRLFACADDLKKVREVNERNNCAASKGRAVVKGTETAAPSGPAAPAAPSTPPSSPPGGNQPPPGPTPEPPEGNDPKELEKGAVTSLKDGTRFLYTGDDPIQQDVAPGAISEQRIAVLRGKVISQAGEKLEGVRLTVLDHGEYGKTWTNEDGTYDMAVNGAQLDIVYEKDGYLPVQKQIDAPWQDYMVLEDVVLTPLDGETSKITLNSGDPFQVATGSSGGPPGSKPATLLFPGGLQAAMKMPDGSSQPLSGDITVRATEFASGGPERLPGTMPGNVAPTYAAEFTVDEAIAAGAQSVEFSAPVLNYTVNFIGASVGSAAPTAFYDRQGGKWEPSPNGRVIKITAITNGKAELDVDKTPGADTGIALTDLGITDAERETLAELYEAGTELWRIPLMHFTPWDHNWPYGPPPGAQPPKLKDFVWKDPNDPCNQQGSIIACESQNLGEEIAITGTPFNLRYDSSRQPGYHVNDGLEVPITGGSIPDRLKGVEVTVDIAGREYKKRWCDPNYPTTGEITCQGNDPIAPNLTWQVEWDGKDAYGREVTGLPVATVKQIYVYEFNYYETKDDFDNAFSMYPDGVEFFNGAVYCGSSNPTLTGETARLQHFLCGILMVEKAQKPLGSWSAQNVDNLGGLTLSAHHGYDPQEKVTYLGDGSTIRSEPLGSVTRKIAGTGSGYPPANPVPAKSVSIDYLTDIAAGPDGSIYGHSGSNQNRIWRVDPDGNIATIGGRITTDPTLFKGNPDGDEGPALNSRLGSDAIKLDVGADGTVYFSTYGIGPNSEINGYIRSITPDGIVHTIAGKPWNHALGGEAYIPFGANGDGGPAKQAALTDPIGIHAGPDGSVYFSERAGWPNKNSALVRRIAPDGTITTVAGGGTDKAADGVTNAPFTDNEDLGTGEPAKDQVLGTPYGLAAAADGSLYITDPTAKVVQRVGPDGRITRVAGNHTTQLGYGLRNENAGVNQPTDIAISPEGKVVVRTNDPGSSGSEVKLLTVDSEGLVEPLAGAVSNPGTCYYCSAPDGEQANRTRIESNSVGVDVLPDGRTVFADGRHEVRIIEPALPGFGGDTIAVPSTDGSEVYVFNGRGRHMRTVDGLTGATLLSFDYDGENRLTKATDVSGNVTTIERDGDGTPTAIVAPGGQRTTLGVDGNGRMKTVADPSGAATELGYHPGGLLATFAEPGRPPAKLDYSDAGRLVRDESPTGDVQTLEREETAGKSVVKVTSGEGHVTTYTVEALLDGNRRRTIKRPTGAVTEVITKPDGTQVLTEPDGTVTTLEFQSDPRWGMRAPLVAAKTTKTPDGRTRIETQTRTVTLNNPIDPLSLKSQTTSVTVDDGAGPAVANTTTTSYDAATRTVERADGLSHRVTTKLDDKGRVISLDPDGWQSTLDPITTDYDANGQVKKVTQGSASWTFMYDAKLRLDTRTDAAGHVFGYAYDDADQVTERRFPGGRTYGYGYAADGALKTITMPSGKVHTFGADDRGRLTTYAAPGAPGPYTRKLDKDGAVDLLTLPSGKQRDVSFETSGLESGVDYGPEADAIEYGTDSERPSKLTRTPNGGTATAMTMGFDGVLPKSTTFSGAASGGFAYTFDNLLQLTDVTLTSGGDTKSTAYAYDRDGRPTKQGPFTLERNGPGGRVSRIFDGTVDVTYGYDKAGRMTKRELRTGGVLRYGFTLTYNNVGEVAKRVETIGGATQTLDYERDVNGELMKVKDGATVVEQFDYDANGNRKLHGNQAATFDDQDRLLDLGGVDYDFDADGFLTGRGGDSFTYASSGDLLTATANGKAVGYAYDALGRRVARNAGGESEEYLYGDPSDPFRVSALRGPAGALSTLYYDDEGVLLALERNGTMHYVGSDQVGSPRLVFTADGTVAKRVDYDAFGAATDQHPSFWLPIGFGGGLSDPDTGLVRFGMRDYDPAAGRFVAKDPSFFEGSPGNLYAYAGSDPVSMRDPTGLFCIGATLYDGIGGGGEYCRKNGKNSICAEVGVGVGGGVAVDPFGDAQKDSWSIQAELVAKYGPLQAGVGAELDLDCFNGKGYVKGGLAVGGLQAKLDTNGKASWQSKGKSKSSYDGSGTRNSDGSWGTKIEGKVAMKKCWAF